MTDPSHRITALLSWLTKQREEVDLELACAEHPRPEKGVERHTVARLPGCLADLPDHLFLELLLCGAAHLYPRVDGCARAAQARARVDALALLVDACGHTGRLRAMVSAPKGRKRPVMDATHLPVSRRQVLLLSGSRARRDMPLEYHSAQERLVDAWRLLSAQAPPQAATLPGTGLAFTAPACTACGMCVRTCPEDALRLFDTGVAPEDAGLPEDGPTTPAHGPHARHVLRLEVRPARCTSCRACVAACPVGTLTPTGPWSAASLWSDAPEAVVDVLTRRCARCGTRLPVGPEPATREGEKLCGPCSFRRENPFGMALPAEALDRLHPQVRERLEADMRRRAEHRGGET